MVHIIHNSFEFDKIVWSLKDQVKKFYSKVRRLAPIPAGESQDVTNNSCSICLRVPGVPGAPEPRMYQRSRYFLVNIKVKRIIFLELSISFSAKICLELTLCKVRKSRFCLFPHFLKFRQLSLKFST